MTPKDELRKRIEESGSLYDDFEEMSNYWDYRKDNFAGFEHEKSVIRLWTGPTEALYYSNAELSDGLFDELLWHRKTFEAKVRLSFLHYGSAGWGFWNHTMVFDSCMPIWFIHLQSRGPYMFQGFFAQVRNHFYLLKLYRGSLSLVSMLSKLSGGKVGVLIHSVKPAVQDLDLTQWHIYKIDWGERWVYFYIDGKPVARLPNVGYESKARVDFWIDNAVFGYNRRDAGRVYRHLTQENRLRTYLEIDYVKVY
ncbi:MAG: family 16 glycosylhydrolase [Thermofilaceae archaeon]